MPREFVVRKNAILASLAVLITGDLALAVYSKQLSSSPSLSPNSLEIKLRQKDIEAAQKIRDELPKTRADCDRFEKSLFAASSGYSTVSSELGALARQNAIHLEDLSFKTTDVPERGLKEIGVDLIVNGGYKNVIQFLNGVQRSTHYEVDSLTLAAENASQASSNVIKVAVHLKTYFRTAA